MSLKEKLDEHSAQFERTAPKEIQVAIRRAIDAAIESGYEERALGVGDKAPEFALADAEGRTVLSADLLKSGPLVVSFYRGVWCPFCNMELQSLQEFSEELRSRGANIVAISPESGANSRRAARDYGITFPILVDAGCKVADEFGVLYMPPDYIQEIYVKNGIDLPKVNAAPDWRLPMPARYLIGQDGVIRYAQINPDYTRRPEPEDLREPLDLCGID